ITSRGAEPQELVDLQPLHTQNSKLRKCRMEKHTMSYAGNRICCDADSHIRETFDWLKSYADPDIRDALPALKLGGAGKMAEKAIAKAVQARTDAANTAELRMH